MSIFDENIEPKFEDLLKSLDWYETERLNSSCSYTYSGADCANRYFIIEFFPKGYISEEVSENYDNTIVKKSRKDIWRVYYQQDCSKTIGYDAKASAYNAGDLGSVPGLGRSPGEGKGYPLQ